MPVQPILQQRHRNQVNDVVLCLKFCRAAYVFRRWARDQRAQTREAQASCRDSAIPVCLMLLLSEGGPRILGPGPGPFSRFLNSGGGTQKNAAGNPLLKKKKRIFSLSVF